MPRSSEALVHLNHHRLLPHVYIPSLEFESSKGDHMDLTKGQRQIHGQDFSDFELQLLLPEPLRQVCKLPTPLGASFRPWPWLLHFLASRSPLAGAFGAFGFQHVGQGHHFASEGEERVREGNFCLEAGPSPRRCLPQVQAPGAIPALGWSELMRGDPMRRGQKASFTKGHVLNVDGPLKVIFSSLVPHVATVFHTKESQPAALIHHLQHVGIALTRGSA
mmetsp:Transcript_59936/g.140219  ORF Transcript_59936/g.140219 Transcript_59936/m.140219 type:complete len:220 (+) Transcript_59936:412-1071(+)